MSNYIEVKNDKSIIINDSYQNVSFDYSVAVRGTNKVDDSKGYRFSDISSGSYLWYSSTNTIILYFHVPADKIIGIYCPSPNFGISPMRLYNGEWLEVRVKNRVGGSAKEILNVDLILYYFSYKSSDQSNGLQVMNANGECIFNSNLKYLRVIDYILQRDDNDPNDIGPRSYNCNIALMIGCLQSRGGKAHAKDQYVYFPNRKSFGVYVYDQYVESDNTSKEVYGCTSIVVINTDNY